MKGIFFGIVTLLCFVLLASLQSAEPWKPLFNGKDFTGWTVPARGDGPSLSPAEAGWKMEDGIIVGDRPDRVRRVGVSFLKRDSKTSSWRSTSCLPSSLPPRTARVPIARTTAACLCEPAIR